MDFTLEAIYNLDLIYALDLNNLKVYKFPVHKSHYIRVLLYPLTVKLK